jgi:hypothetical protein
MVLSLPTYTGFQHLPAYYLATCLVLVFDLVTMCPLCLVSTARKIQVSLTSVPRFPLPELHTLLWRLTKRKRNDPAPSPASRGEKAPRPMLLARDTVNEQQPVTGCQRVWTPGDMESASAGPTPDCPPTTSGSSTARGDLCDSSTLHDRAAVIARSSTDADEETGPCFSLNSRTKGGVGR